MKSILFKIFAFIVINFIYPIFSNNLKVETININIDRLQNKDDNGQINKNKKQQQQQQKPIKIIQLSDIHYDKIPLRITDKFLEKIVKTTNDLKPDLILITGDLIERDPIPISQLYNKHLSKLKSKYGVYSILGNHDYKNSTSPEIIKNALKNTNINLLENEIVYPMGKENGDDGSGAIQLIGFDNYAKRDKKQMDELNNEIKSSSNENLIKLALVHNPDHVIQMLLKDNSLNMDIALCGHSHGSQICFPSFNFLGFKIGSGSPVMPHFESLLQKIPFKFIRDIKYPGKKTLKYWQYGKGYHKIMNNDNLLIGTHNSNSNSSNSSSNNNNITKLNLYVNRGLGTHPPIRLFCDPEITVINIYQ
ncbi:hypothetical protein ACTFIR_004510 [Dictyostelium discoideum]